ncbi:MAG: NlpC/P60 family protein [Nocardia sp.]|uniref:C40 family peptidase n=1 Tax=Nocardia sp. TaxID=1821 RepID=UPI00263275E6|nr:NlpC/P60 family protein [Nocardia sp.]MCU1647626.1 NlpC/P60 family protein [Nocardia sp.]
MPDPISVIATIVMAATGAIDNSDLPNDAKVSAQAAVESGGEAAKSLVVQLDNAVAQFAPLTAPSAPATQPDTEAPASTPPQHDEHASSPQPAQDTRAPKSHGDEYAVSPTRFDSLPVTEAAAVPAVNSGNIAAFVPWFQKAGALCSGIKAPTLAALYAAENGFHYGPNAPVSPAGALGPGQFMPGTWAVYGKDVHGTGVADVFDIGDSVMASGHLLCDSYQQIESWKAQGLVTGDTVDLTIAAYNAGAGAVLRSGGMPSGSPDYENQTKPYVTRIRATEGRYDWIDAAADMLRPATATGARIVARAVEYLDTPYVWGGGGSDGPSGGGFDCSGLTAFAIHAATGGAVTLPRTSQGQWQIGTEIPFSDAAPGDLLFGNWGPDGPGHVAIYLGDGRMIHAPTPGDVVRISPVMTGMLARRIS